MINTVIGFQNFFPNETRPNNPFDLVRHLPKEKLFFEISLIISQLDSSIEQVQILKFLLKRDITAEFYSQISSDSRQIVFYKFNCLYILEYLKNTAVQGNIECSVTVDYWILFKFILLINDKLTQISDKSFPNIYNTSDPISSRIPNLTLNVNELRLQDNLFYGIVRAQFLINGLLNNERYGERFKQFIRDKYGATKNEIIDLLSSIKYLVTSNKSFGILKTTYLSENKNLIAALSKTGSFQERDYVKLISIRKFPLYLTNSDEIIIGDINLLVKKFNSQLFHDFWFDYLKPSLPAEIIDTDKDEISMYNGVLGLIFEQYVSKHIFNSLITNRNIIFKPNLIEKGKEFCDIYLRVGKKIALIEIKSNAIVDKLKFPSDFIRLDEELLDNFGINQLVKSTVRFISNEFMIFDENLEKDGSYIIYPILVINDKALDFETVHSFIQSQFATKLSDEIKSKSLTLNALTLKDLTLVHIGNLEKLEHDISSNPSFIFRVIELTKGGYYFNNIMMDLDNSLRAH